MPESPQIVLTGIDVSNYQGADISGLLDRYRPHHVVVRLSTESDGRRQIARAQLAEAVQAGKTVSGYVWCYWKADPAAHCDDALSVAGDAPLATVWLDAEDERDAEPGRIIDWLAAAVEHLEKKGLRVGIYTGAWFWRQYVWDSHDFTRLPLWYANYDGISRLDTWPNQAFGGWERPAGKQWTDHPADFNVFLADVVTPPQTPQPEDRVAALTTALAYVCDDLGDQLDALRKQLDDKVTELRRVRAQFLGPR